MPIERKNVSEDSLEKVIKAQITLEGPISLSTYMGLCLTHPKYGYYKNTDVLGKDGDFITAPEISQMFGEFIGLYIAQAWIDLGSPEKFNLVELGPGRGTLLEDAFRVFNKVEGLSDALQLNLLETNEVFVKLQAKKLGQYKPNWIKDINQLQGDEIPLLIIANEFFDALPIKQFQKQDDKWFERAIGIKEDKLAWGLEPKPVPSESLPANINDALNGSIWEVGFASLRLMSEISALIAKNGGAILAIDYGYAQTQTGDSFQALKNHEPVNVLEHIGKADLSSHVDFEALAKAASNAGAIAQPLKTQAEFLSLLGIEQRSEQLIKANPSLEEEITSAKKRLVSTDQMGSLFKVLSISSRDFNPFPFNSD